MVTLLWTGYKQQHSASDETMHKVKKNPNHVNISSAQTKTMTYPIIRIIIVLTTSKRGQLGRKFFNVKLQYAFFNKNNFIRTPGSFLLKV